MAPSFAQAAISLLCLGSAWANSHYAAVLDKRAAVIPSTLPGTWLFQGCYTDTGARVLSGSSYVNATSMTDESCIKYCDGLGYFYAGTEYSSECYCGATISSSSSVAPIPDCSMTCVGNSSEICGGPSRLSVFWNGKNPPPGPSTNPGVLGFGFYGCYTEGTNGRALTNPVSVIGGSSAMTVALCIQACNTAGFPFAGAEYSQECYCGNSLQNAAVVAPEGLSSCNMLCSGNSSEYCGAGNRLDIYKLGYAGVSTTSTMVSSTLPSSQISTSLKASIYSSSTVHKSSSSSQFTSTSTSSKLTTSSSSKVSTSPSSSQATSSSSNSVVSLPTSSTKSLIVSSSVSSSTSSSFKASASLSKTSTSTSSVSFVSSILPSSSSKSSAVSPNSSMTSPSVSLQVSRTSTPSTAPTLGIKQTIGLYSFVGCYTEGTGVRALTAASFFNYTSMSLESCASSCAGCTYWGVEYGGECYCGNTLASTSVLATSQMDCSFTCPGNAFEYCGAGNRLEMYKLTSSVSSSSSSVVVPTTTGASSASLTVASTTTASSSISPQTSSATRLPRGWKYAGCYSEGVNGRALQQQQPDSQTNSVETCISTCIGLGYSVAGLEFGAQCFCDNFLYNGAAPATASSCSMACPGNSQELCGAGNFLSIYNTGNLTVYQAPTTQKTGLPGSWHYQGCYTDNVNDNRALFWQIILTNNNTATSCLGLCQQYGYMAAGMEYGDECYCGDAPVLAASGSTQAPETDCQVPCSGNNNYYCGGGSRLSYYTWNGTPLNVWHTPTGSAAGSYQFLIGGVVVPLITTTGINNKVVFMEKSGTGAPNTTGTYELDLAFIDDFANAWRPLHVKSDIFCSAGVTLPDKAGRQLNIGGWAGASTYGVRLYWPDGSPGVPGKNDWQENVSEVSLLAGRWYPSAMIMANGSVLVLGGEVGSNSAPTPSCEILPPPPGGYAKYLDWLMRTDPDNLYPFMFVLPTGGIFVVYYNEARIIDEVTFDTVKTLPNLPGSVSNFLAGRTYPLEGTGVLLPQLPPYSDPVTVLVCGGSANGAALAIDNCVSTQPEVANPQWTLERMPSQRVMSCMCALPDGTYLILNGAKQGVAGFGLATDPNYNAVLYDPSLAVNQRFSIMATTIVARLYHSEAILLPDGRVLVSGSDPEDGTHPEEYRVEVFLPPYALSGLPAPSFTIANVDWLYASTATITANIPSRNLASVRVSMMAAVSSTHGNSMGQRTLFLSVSCVGATNAATCTLTTPPTAHVAPPGWYQIFVLDGPTPGPSKWIRIGGSIADAANIGNWPNYSDFSTPGLGAVGK